MNGHAPMREILCISQRHVKLIEANSRGWQKAWKRQPTKTAVNTKYQFAHFIWAHCSNFILFSPLLIAERLRCWTSSFKNANDWIYCHFDGTSSLSIEKKNYFSPRFIYVHVSVMLYIVYIYVGVSIIYYIPLKLPIVTLIIPQWALFMKKTFTIHEIAEAGGHGWHLCVYQRELSEFIRLRRSVKWLSKLWKF